MKSTIKFISGDATSPQSDGNKIICHICNDIGGWGRGFVLALSNKWNEPEQAYRNWFSDGQDFELGNIQFVKVEHDLWVANMIAQRDTKRAKDGTPPIRYEAVKVCLQKLALDAKEKNASVHMPRIGCGLAGGSWDIIGKIVTEELIAKNIAVNVYDL